MRSPSGSATRAPRGSSSRSRATSTCCATTPSASRARRREAASSSQAQLGRARGAGRRGAPGPALRRVRRVPARGARHGARAGQGGRVRRPRRRDRRGPILLSLNDPLVHLVRNCVDHGLETPDDRAAGGQAPRRQVASGARRRRPARHHGRGRRPRDRPAEAPRRRRCARGSSASSRRRACPRARRSSSSSRRASPRASRRARPAAAAWARRGGKRVKALGGSVDGRVEPGKGARFTLRLPQSLALMKVLLVRLGDDVYGIPAVDVESVGRARPEDATEVSGTLRGAPPRAAHAAWSRSGRCWRSTAARARSGRSSVRASTATRARRWWWTASSASARWR